MTLEDMTSASEVIYEVVDPDANIIVGAVIDEKLEGEIQVTVIATGFESNQPYTNQKSRNKLTNQSVYNQSEIREPGPGIPDFLRLRQIRRDEES